MFYRELFFFFLPFLLQAISLRHQLLSVVRLSNQFPMSLQGTYRSSRLSCISRAALETLWALKYRER